jgi:hypothetical protein
MKKNLPKIIVLLAVIAAFYFYKRAHPDFTYAGTLEAELVDVQPGVARPAVDAVHRDGGQDHELDDPGLERSLRVRRGREVRRQLDVAHRRGVRRQHGPEVECSCRERRGRGRQLPGGDQLMHEGDMT